ncbi:MAG: hypothetical protein OXC41_07885 [Gammaproteobacteria bacterium]|nr:hypothetical protein [Gammaproteobacteria bacterium]
MVECTAIIELYKQVEIIDEESAKYIQGECNEGWMPTPSFEANPVFGCELRGQINAKNSLGEYTGFQDYWD